MTLQHIKYCEAVSRHFKIPKKITRNIGEDYFKSSGGVAEKIVLDFRNVSEQYGFKLSAVCTSLTLQLSALLSLKKVKNSELYGTIINTFTNTDADIVTFPSGNILVAAYFAERYSGECAIFLHDKKENSEGIVFEPIQYYLNGNYPIEKYEV